jgi:hypothetical protein
VHTLYLAWQASAWLTSRAKRGLRQTATATDTTGSVSGASGHPAAGDAVAMIMPFCWGLKTNERIQWWIASLHWLYRIRNGGVHACLTFNPHGFGLITITGLGRPESTNHIFGLNWTVDICRLHLCPFSPYQSSHALFKC